MEDSLQELYMGTQSKLVSVVLGWRGPGCELWFQGLL